MRRKINKRQRYTELPVVIFLRCHMRQAGIFMIRFFVCMFVCFRRHTPRRGQKYV